MDHLPIVAAGREVPDAVNRIRRYCGLSWSGGQPQTWAWHYYDAVASQADDVVTATDVVCAAALHPGLSRSDLEFFRERQDELSAWLGEVPTEKRLWELSLGDIDHVAALPESFPDISVSLLSKVLHRKRPHCIPPIDRHVIDWYRPVTGKRAMTEAWDPIMRAMREEELDSARRLFLALVLGEIAEELWPNAAAFDRPQLSWIRAIDIAIWMDSR